jgi:hypothetical protein
VRPPGKAGLKPRHCILTGTFTMSRWSRGDDVRAGLTPSLRACSARSSGGLVIGAGMAYRGKPSGDAKGDFLGEMHSVRPPGKAGLKPRHCILTGTFTVSRWSRGGNVRAGVTPSLAGVRSPPLRGVGYPG